MLMKPVQLDLFSYDPKAIEKEQKMERAMDKIREKFGKRSDTERDSLTLTLYSHKREIPTVDVEYPLRGFLFIV